MTLVSCKLLRANLHYELPLRRPIFEFAPYAPPFFAMISDALAGKYIVSASDFSVRPSNILGEAQFRYNLFGGQASVVLAVEKLIFDFPNVLPTDGPLIISVIQSIHDAFPAAFPSIGYDRTEAQSFSHCDVGDVATVEKALSRFLIPGADKLPDLGPVVQKPLGKLDVTAEDQSWQCSCSIERSLLASNALFIATSLSMRKMGDKSTFAEKLATGRTITRACQSLLGIEMKDAG